MVYSIVTPFNLPWLFCATTLKLIPLKASDRSLRNEIRFVIYCCIVICPGIKEQIQQEIRGLDKLMDIRQYTHFTCNGSKEVQFIKFSKLNLKKDFEIEKWLFFKFLSKEREY